MKYYYFIIILLFSMMGLVSAANSCGNDNSFLGTFKQNEDINLWQSCDDCSYVNLTNIKTPTTINNYNVAMTKSGTNFNYTTSTSTELGCYSYTVCGDKDGTFTCEVIDFEVTPSGFVNSISFYLLILILSLGIIIFGYAIKDAITVLFGSFGLYFIGLYILFYGLVGMKDTVYTWAIGIIVLMMAAYFSIRSSIELLSE